MTTHDDRQRRLHEIAGQGLGIPGGAYAALEQGIAPQALRDWSWHAAVWDRPTAATWPYSPAELARAQDAWDRSRDFVETRREVAAARQAEREQRQAARDREQAERERAERAELETRLVTDYMRAAPGTTEAEARAALPDLLHQHRLREMDTRDRQVAQAVAKMRTLI